MGAADDMNAAFSMPVAMELAMTERQREEEALSEAIKEVARELLKTRDDAVAARMKCGVEDEWVDAQNNYYGLDAGLGHHQLSDTLKGIKPAEQAKSEQPRATVFVQLTRQKTDAVSARIADMAAPTDDRNWALDVTPVVEIDDLIKTAGDTAYVDPETGGNLQHPDEDRVMTNRDALEDNKRAAKEACEKMQTEIDDQLIECRYNGQLRKVIDDAAMLGTGVIAGPIVVNRISRKYSKQGGKYVMQVKEEVKPASLRRDPWNIFPDPACGEDPQQGGYIWEREEISPKELRTMARVKGYNADAIRKCLKEGPLRQTPFRSMDAGKTGLSDTPTAYNSNIFELWTYCGEVTKRQLRMCGCEDMDAAEGDDAPGEDDTLEDAAEGETDDAGSQTGEMNWREDRDDDEEAVQAFIVFCNEEPIKAFLNPLDDGTFPYDFFTLSRVRGRPWGVGIPFMMRYAQKTLNAGWRTMLDNAGVSSMPQIVMDRSVMRPEDGQWNIYGGKLWSAVSDETVDVTKAFTTYDIPNHQEQAAAIIELSMKFADEESGLPMLMQGERGTAPDKVGVAQIMENGANILLRRSLKQLDDQITEPHLTRYYNWNMQYNEKEEIKGDYQVWARASTALIARQQRAQLMGMMLELAANPLYAPDIDPRKMLEQFLESNRISPAETLRPKDEAAAMRKKAAEQPPPQDPRIEAATIQAKASLQAADIEAKSEMANIQARNESMRADDERNTVTTVLDNELQYAKLANERQMSLDETKKDMALEVARVGREREQMLAEGRRLEESTR